MSHILLSPLCTFPCWRLSTSSLVWWQCPWHTLSSHNGVIVIPATHKVETLSSGLSLKLFPALPFCVSFSSSLLLLHYISITHLSCLFILVCTHTNTHTHACTHACMHACTHQCLEFPLFNLLSTPTLLTPLGKVMHWPPAARQTQTSAHSLFTLPSWMHICKPFLSAWSSNT